MHPIWKPYYFTPSAASSSYDYFVEVDDVEVFSGSAYRRPDGVLRIRIDDIVSTFLGNPWPSMTVGDHAAAGLVVSASILDEDYAPEITEDFILDRTYRNTAAQPAYRGEPINGRFDAEQDLVFTHIGTIDITNAGAEVTVPDSNGNMVVAPAGDVVVEGYKFTSVDRCGEAFALYYLNEMGGWDWLLMEGRCNLKYTYNRKTLRQLADANGRTIREYGNDETRTYELRTGWLTDEQAAKMHNLIGSTEAVLWTSELGYLPVVIRDTECPFKTQDGEGRGVVQYTITVDVAEDFERR